MRIRSETDIDPIAVFPGDEIEVTWRDETGRAHVLERQPIGRTMTIDRIVIADLEPGELGFKDGLTAIVGERAR